MGSASGHAREDGEVGAWAASLPRLSEPALLLLLFLLALALRAVAVLQTAVIFNDGPIFIELAGLLREGRLAEVLGHAYHPLYPALIALVQGVTGDGERAGVALSLLGGSLSVLALYAFLRQAWDRSVATVGALLFALSPYAIRFAADVQSDSVYLALFLTAVALLFAALRQDSAWLALATGSVTGLAYLTRPEALGVVLIGAALAFVAWLRGSWSAARLGRWLAALACGLALVAGPYLIAIRSLAGGWTISQKKSVLHLLGLEPGAFEAVIGGGDGPLPHWALGLLVIGICGGLYLGWRGLERVRGSAPSRVHVSTRALAAALLTLGALAIALAPHESLLFFALAASTLRPELVLLLGIGVGSRLRRGPQGRSLFVASFSLLYALVLFLLLLQYGYLSRRHLLPPLALLMGYVASGALVAAELASVWLAPGRRSRTLAGVLLLVAAISLPKAWSDHRGEQLAARRAAEWLQSVPEPGALAGDRSKLGYYAGRAFRPLRSGTALRPLATLRAEQVRFVIAEQDALDERLAPIEALRPDAALMLEERHRVQANGRHAVVFELVER